MENSLVEMLRLYRAVRQGFLISQIIVEYTFFYKHRVYKHAEPQILENFKHIAKHAPGSDFYLSKNFLEIFKYIKILPYFHK